MNRSVLRRCHSVCAIPSRSTGPISSTARSGIYGRIRELRHTDVTGNVSKLNLKTAKDCRVRALATSPGIAMQISDDYPSIRFITLRIKMNMNRW